MEKKKSWDDIPSLDGLEMDWEYQSASSGDKRSNVRLRIAALAKLFEVNEILVRVFGGSQTLTVRVLDLSAGGLSLGMPVPLEVGLLITVGFFLGQRKIIAKAEVRHVREANGEYVTGIRFIDLDKESAQYIRELHGSHTLRHAL